MNFVSAKSSAAPRGPTLPTVASAFPLCGFFISLAIFSALTGSTAPSSLYPIYASRLSLGESASTAIFSIYAIGTLAALTTISQVGDRLGDRRWILIPGIAIAAFGSILFGTAHGLYGLLVGRFLAGVGTGAITSIGTAALFEVEHPTGRAKAAVKATLAFTAGAAFGPVLTSAVIAADFWPTFTPFAFIAAVGLFSAIGLLFSKWPDRTDPSIAALQPAILTASKQSSEQLPSSSFLLASFALCISWAFGAMMMALGATAANIVFGVHSMATAGMIPAAFQIFGGIGQFLFGRIDARLSIRLGLGGLAASQLLLAFGASYGSLTILFLVTPIAGLLYGAAFVGAAGLVNRTATPSRRAKTAAHFYMMGYLANALPTIALGEIVDAVGLTESIIGYWTTLAALSTLGVVLERRRSAGHRDVTALTEEETHLNY